MRTILLAFAIIASGAAKNIQDVCTKNTNTHKVKKGETATQIANKNDITILELKSLNRNINLSHLPIGTVIITSKNKQHASCSQLHSNQSSQNATTYNRWNTTSFIKPLPKVPVANHGPLLHLEHVIPLELTPSHMLNSAGLTGEATPTRTTISGHSALTKIRQMITNKKNVEPNELVKVSTSTPFSAGFNMPGQNGLNLFWPVETRTISSTWGPRIRTKVVRVRVSKRSKRQKQVLKQFLGNHKGVDLSAPQGDDVFAAMDGQIITSGNHKHYGNFVTIDHGNGVMTLYGHCYRNFVIAGETVRRGQKIAEVGCTGNATGPHVHFELRLDGTAQNPLPFMNNAGEVSTAMIAKNQPSTSATSPRRVSSQYLPLN